MSWKSIAQTVERYRRAILAVILVLATILRLRGSGHQSFWYDESLTLESARALLGGVIESVVRLENMPPGHFVLLNRWALLLGASEFSLRLPSAWRASLPSS